MSYKHTLYKRFNLIKALFAGLAISFGFILIIANIATCYTCHKK